MNDLANRSKANASSLRLLARLDTEAGRHYKAREIGTAADLLEEWVELYGTSESDGMTVVIKGK